MACKGKRKIQVLNLFGLQQFSRSYHYCGDCRRSAFPDDELFGLQHQCGQAVRELICLAGILDSFSEAAGKILPRFCGLFLSTSTVQRISEETGFLLGEQLAGKQVPGEAAEWDWYEDTEGKTCAYVSVDATGVGQQAANSGSAEGRMVYVGLVSNPVPIDWEGKKPESSTRYVTSVSDLSGLGVPLRAQAGAVGMDQADRWIALSDGGAGLEDFFRVNFPRCEVVLDFYHAAEHVCEFVKLLTGNNRLWRDSLSQWWCHRLKHEGGKALLAAVAALSFAEGSEVEQGRRDLQRYLENHHHKMDYPRYQQLGWHIGSGAIESACKNVVGRLKGPGMRWRMEGTQGVCHLRALYKSEQTQWASFWQNA